MKKTITVPLPSISPNWKVRLLRALDTILVFSEVRGRKEILTHAHSINSRTILELAEEDRILTRASLQLALPEADDLEMLKLGCWTLLYLKAIFPDWLDVEGWVKEAAEWATEESGPIEKKLQDYRITCLYEPLANVLDFQIVRS